jgi:hypothetical protein
MSSPKFLDARLSRRSWVALAVSALSGCGGGGTDTAGLPGTGGTGASYPGTGGTGIYQGSITGFGSVIVNGVTFDNSSANMQINGVDVEQDRLRLGMVATVRGVHNVNTATGMANSVEVWAIGQGRVYEVQSNQFKVAGMTIRTNSATWFYDLASPLSEGAYVSVWGLQADSDGETWTASCVQASSAAASVIGSGRVKFDDGERKINDLVLTGTVANNLPNETLMRVQGTLDLNGALRVQSAQAITSSVVAQAQGDVEIEGLITSAVTASGFMLGSISVNTSTSTYEPAGALLVLGSKVEVYGYWQNGVLRATKVELEDGHSSSEVSIKAVLQQFTSLSDFVMQGQRCDATGAEISSSARAALPTSAGAVGNLVFKVKGSKSGDWLLVSSMELDH